MTTSSNHNRPQDMQEVLHLRPHHGMCILNYRGHGYSDAFSRHMDATVRHLMEHPETEIEIADHCDDLCAYCPNREGTRCTSPRPQLFDHNVLCKTGLTAAQHLTWEQFSARTEEYSLYHLEEMCPDCNWLPLCKEIAAERAAQSVGGCVD